jgi:hypothetical protein
MPERTHQDDFDELLGAAEEALEHALRDGSCKGFAPGDWLRHNADHHLQHAEEHIRALTSNTSTTLLREDLSHAVCRLLMVWAKQETE